MNAANFGANRFSGASLQVDKLFDCLVLSSNCFFLEYVPRLKTDQFSRFIAQISYLRASSSNIVSPRKCVLFLA